MSHRKNTYVKKTNRAPYGSLKRRSCELPAGHVEEFKQPDDPNGAKARRLAMSFCTACYLAGRNVQIRQRVFHKHAEGYNVLIVR